MSLTCVSVGVILVLELYKPWTGLLTRQDQQALHAKLNNGFMGDNTLFRSVAYYLLHIDQKGDGAL